MRRVFVTCLCTFAAVSAAHADHASKGKPDWCSHAKPIDFDPESYISSDGWSDKTLNYIAAWACGKPDDPARQQKVAAMREQWLAYSGLSDADDRAANVLRANADDFEREQREMCDTSALRPDDDDAPLVKLRKSALRAMACQEAQDSSFADDPLVMFDRNVDIPELDKIALVHHCLVTYAGYAGNGNGSTGELIATYASCSVDARSLDKARFERELAGAKLNAYGMLRAREYFARTKKTADDMTAAVQALAKKKEGYRKLLFEIPDQAFADWKKQYDANKDAFDRALAFEDKSSDLNHKDAKGCDASLRKDLAAYVRSKKPKTLDAAKTAMTDAIGYRLLLSLGLCESLQEHKTAAGIIYELLHEDHHPYRGPRYAAQWAMLDALGELMHDDRKLKIGHLSTPPAPDALIESIGTGGTNLTYLRPAHATVASVKKTAGGAAVTFKTVSWKEPSYDCVETTKIDYIQDGHVVYRQSCRQNGSETKTSTVPPLEIAPGYDAGLKIGELANVMVDDEDFKHHKGIPLDVYSGADKKHLVGYFGIALTP